MQAVAIAIFFDNDYVYVTLIDMLLLQIACKDNNIGGSPAIDGLIASKVEYLKTTEHDIFSDNPKTASGERIDSACVALRLYKKLHGQTEDNS